MPEINEALREHTTSIAFNLTLSKAMINHLVLVHFFKGDDRQMHKHKVATRSWIVSMKCLQDRGLIIWAKPIYKTKRGFGGQVRYINGWKPYRLTKAGTLVVNLLKEAGIYQETVERLNLSHDEEKVSA